MGNSHGKKKYSKDKVKVVGATNNEEECSYVKFLLFS